tara:strand:- start:154 stop:1320 length:1167 start_codon:yes stop_codon:yes gene_type:complete
MKKVFTLIGALFSASILLAQGIQFFEGSFKEALVRANKENKLVFVDAYATWCGPCKLMTKDVFSDEKVAEFYNKNFINMKIDQEAGEGIQFAKDYKVNLFPTLLYIDSKGTLAHKSYGYHEPIEFISLGRNAIHPETQLLSLQIQYLDKGGMKSKHLRNLVDALSIARLPYNEVLDTYITNESLEDPDMIRFIVDYFPSTVNCEVFQYITSNKELILKITQDSDGLNKKINATLHTFLKEQGESDEKNILATFKQYFPESCKIEAERFNINRLKESADKEDQLNYLYRKVGFLLEHGTESWEELNAIAWKIYEDSEDMKLLSKAQELAKNSLDIDYNFYNVDTYTWICVKLGEIDTASKYAEKALFLGMKQDADVTQLEDFLKSLADK